MKPPGRRLRVLVVSLGRRGGTTKYGYLMSRALAEHADIAVVSASAAENSARWAEIECPHLEVPTFSSVPTLLLSIFAVSRFARIRRFARDFGPDIVYYPHGHAWKLLLDLLLPRRAATVLTIHDPQLHRGEDSLLHRMLDASSRLHVDGYVLLNSFQRDEFVMRFRSDPPRVAVIPLGILDDTLADGRPLPEAPEVEAVAHLWGRYALFVGRIRAYKGIATLLEAYSSISAEESFPLVMAGEGRLSKGELAALQALTGREVVLLNRWLSDAEMASLMEGARFVVLPYLSATQSGVIPLASALGVPAIASHTGGIEEQVVEGETGFLVAPGDARSLADALRSAFGMDDEAYARMSEGCPRPRPDDLGLGRAREMLDRVP